MLDEVNLTGRGSSHSALLNTYFERDPMLLQRYRRLRRHAGGIVASNYDVSDRCNLLCEGCLYFAGSDRDGHADTRRDAEWDGLFAAERARGVNYAYLAGAEPGLSPNRLRLAAQHIGRGAVFTNGTIPIDRRLPFVLHVSLWGDAAETSALRGGTSFSRAFRLYSDDPRARFIFTVNARNVMSAWSIAERCASAGRMLSFSIFSPTEQYRAKLASRAPNDGAYFRISSPEASLAPTPDDLREIAVTLDAIAMRYPDTVVYTPAYSGWISNPAGLFRIDTATGWAVDCGVRNTPHHRHVRADLSTSASKCCSPNIVCRDCRAYAMASGTAVSRFRRFAASYQGFRSWLDIAEQWAALFLLDWPAREGASA
jgi:hypothetical protein